MTKKIVCQNKDNTGKVKVRVIKAPLVNSQELKQIIFARTKAIVL